MLVLLSRLKKTFPSEKLIEYFLLTYKVVDMFNFFSDVKNAIKQFEARILDLEHKVEALFKEQQNAKQDTQAEEVHGGGSAQPADSQEGGDTPIGSEGIQSSGHSEVQEQTNQ